MKSRTAAALAPGRVEAARDLLVLRGPDRGVHAPGLLAPLDPDTVVAALLDLGFVPGGTVRGPGGATSQHWTWPAPGLAVRISGHSDDGGLKWVSVTFDGDAGSPAATAIRTAMAELAERLDARLVAPGTQALGSG